MTACVCKVCTDKVGHHLELQRMGVEEARWGWGRAPSWGRPGLLKHSLTLIIFINARTLQGNIHMIAATHTVAELLCVV